MLQKSLCLALVLVMATEFSKSLSRMRFSNSPEKSFSFIDKRYKHVLNLSGTRCDKPKKCKRRKKYVHAGEKIVFSPISSCDFSAIFAALGGKDDLFTLFPLFAAVVISSFCTFFLFLVRRRRKRESISPALPSGALQALLFKTDIPQTLFIHILKRERSSQIFTRLLER